MQWNKRSKLGAGVVALGLAFVAYDRFSGGPAPADAAAPAPAAAAPAHTAPALEINHNQGALAAKLDELRPQPSNAVADVFKAPADWFPAPKEDPKSEVPVPTKPKYELRSVNILTPRAGGTPVITAVIDGHRLTLGKNPEFKDADGTTVTLISAERRDDGSCVAVIEVKGEQVQLKLDAPK